MHADVTGCQQAQRLHLVGRRSMRSFYEPLMNASQIKTDPEPTLLHTTSYNHTQLGYNMLITHLLTVTPVTKTCQDLLNSTANGSDAGRVASWRLSGCHSRNLETVRVKSGPMMERRKDMQVSTLYSIIPHLSTMYKWNCRIHVQNGEKYALLLYAISFLGGKDLGTLTQFSCSFSW